MTPLKIHDILMAKNAVARAFHFEVLDQDPVVDRPGRFWSTSTGGVKYSFLDANKAVQVGVIANADDLAKAIALLQGQIATAASNASTGVADEAARALAAEGVLNTAINKEIADRVQALLDEAAARTDGIAGAQASAASALDTETQARLAGDKAQSDATAAVQAELDATQAGVGLPVDGKYVAPEHTKFLAESTSVIDGLVKVDAALDAEGVRALAAEKGLQDQITTEVQARVADIAAVTKTVEDYVNGKIADNSNADAVEAKARLDGDKAIQAELDATQLAIGTNDDGTYKAPTTSNYLTSATTVMGGVEALDSAVKVVADALAAETVQRTSTDDGFRINLQNEITARTAADTAFQLELDATQAGGGLESDGSYKASDGTTYLGAATSLKDADVKLDAAVKAVADRAGVIETVALPALTKAVTDEIARAQAAEAAAAKAAADEAARALAAEGVIVKSVTDEATRAQGAEAGIQGQVDALKASAGEGASALKAALNAGRKPWEATAAALTHIAPHNFGHQNFIAQILVKGDDGVFRNEVMPWEIKDDNSITVYLSEAGIIRVNFISTAQLA